MLIPIRTYPTTEEAYIVCGLLESHGIRAEVQDTAGNSVFPSLDDNNGSSSVIIDSSDRTKAEELLLQHED